MTLKAHKPKDTMSSELFLTIYSFNTFVGAECALDDAFMSDIGFPCRSGCMVREDGSMFENAGNDFDADDASLEICVLEALLGRTLTADMKGKSFKVVISAVEEFDPEAEVER